MEIEPLWEHQKLTIEKARGLNYLGVLHDAGVGKTRTTIEILREVYGHEGRLLRTLVFGPGVVVENWRREILRFSKIQPRDIVLLQGTGAKRLKTFQDNCKPTSDPTSKVVIANYQTLLMKDIFELFEAWKPEIIVLDESHRTKSPQAKTTKAAIHLGDMAKYRYILTGTPILQSLLDLYSQFRFLDGGRTFGKNFFIFRNTYFYDKNAGMPSQRHFPDWKVKPNAEQEISQKIKAISTVARKSDCLDLPVLVKKQIYVPLSPIQQKHYDEMKKHFITFLDDKACTAQLAITKALRLQQIISGFIKTEDGQETRFKDNPRIDALKELLEDLTPNHKVIIWSCWREDYGQIRDVCEKLGIASREVTGDTPQNERQKAIDDFNNDPGVRVFIGNQAASGIGVNLTASDHAIYYSRNFSLEQQLQSEARNYRGGSEQHSKVTHIDLIAKDTIDELIVEALSNKLTISENVLRDISKRL